MVSGVAFHPSTDPDDIETGTASWYGPGFDGRKTASGERFDEDALTAAHPSFDMPSLNRPSIGGFKLPSFLRLR